LYAPELLPLYRERLIGSSWEVVDAALSENTWKRSFQSASKQERAGQLVEGTEPFNRVRRRRRSHRTEHLRVSVSETAFGAARLRIAISRGRKPFGSFVLNETTPPQG
jgi:hypothetical protein